jgi:hypothetical protein
VNLILENTQQVAWYTDMASTLLAMGVDPRAYDWYLSDIETNVSVPQLDDGDTWLKGDELAVLLAKPIQCIWGVFSAFPPGLRAPVDIAPAANRNLGFWQPPDARPQLPGACFELVCWDSSATLLVGVSEEQAARFLMTYPDAKPLSSTWPKML